MSEQKSSYTKEYVELVSLAENHEKEMFCGKSCVDIDGSPYTSVTASVSRDEMVSFDFRVAKYLFEGEYPMAFIRSSVRARKEEESLADPNCANWIVWTIFNLLGVSRIRKWEE